jgi:hypothetical protein
VLKGGKSGEFWQFELGNGSDGPKAQPVVSPSVGHQLIVAPNPARLRANVDIGVILGVSARLEVVDAAGRVRSTTRIRAGVSGSSVDLSSLEPGQYFVVLAGPGLRSSGRLTVLP